MARDDQHHPTAGVFDTLASTLQTPLPAAAQINHPVRHRSSEMRAKARQLLQACGEAGSLVAPLALQLGISANSCSGHLAKLRQAGQAVRREAPTKHGPRTTHWWAVEFAHAAPPDVPAVPKIVKPTRNLVLDHDQPTIVPAGLEVQQCPSGTDTRYTATVPAGGGVISQDWRQARREQRRAA